VNAFLSSRLKLVVQNNDDDAKPAFVPAGLLVDYSLDAQIE